NNSDQNKRHDDRSLVHPDQCSFRSNHSRSRFFTYIVILDIFQTLAARDSSSISLSSAVFLTRPPEPESFLSLHHRRHRLGFPRHFPWRVDPRRSPDKSKRAVLSLTYRALMRRGGGAARYQLH